MTGRTEPDSVYFRFATRVAASVILDFEETNTVGLVSPVAPLAW